MFEKRSRAKFQISPLFFLGILLVLLFALLTGTKLYADAKKPEDKALAILNNHILSEQNCVEQDLIQFHSDLKLTAIKTIGADKCDGYGGRLAHSPKHNIYVYVNFNIPGMLDLDLIDQAYEQYAKQKYPELRKRQLVFVTDKFMEYNTHKKDTEIFYAPMNSIYISSSVLNNKKKKLKDILEYIYTNK